MLLEAGEGGPCVLEGLVPLTTGGGGGFNPPELELVIVEAVLAGNGGLGAPLEFSPWPPGDAPPVLTVSLDPVL